MYMRVSETLAALLTKVRVQTVRIKNTPPPVIFWIVPPEQPLVFASVHVPPLPVTVKLPVVLFSTMPFVPLLAETLSNVTASAPLLRLTPAPAVLVTDTLLIVSEPTLAPPMPVPLLVLTFKPRTVLPEASATLEMVGREAAAMDRFGAIVRPTPWPINCWLLSKVNAPG